MNLLKPSRIAELPHSEFHARPPRIHSEEDEKAEGPQSEPTERTKTVSKLTEGPEGTENV